MGFVKRLHSLEVLGPAANLLVEAIAGWAIVMVATGLVLWWPRSAGQALTIRGTPARRPFWRDLHAVTGLFAGLVVVFLAATGMPWSAVWGKEVRRLTNEAGWGRPKAPAAIATGHEDHAGHRAPALPWALQDGSPTGTAEGAPASVTAIVAHVHALGLPRPYTLSAPARPGAVWSAAHMPNQVEQTRTLYLDPVTGQAVADIGYAHYGPAAKAIEWGISTHQGQQYGDVNRLLMLAGCVAVWVLAVTGLVMWWKRRPRGRQAAPPRTLNRGALATLAAVVAPLGLIYPLVGVTLVAAIAIELAIVLATRPLLAKGHTP